MLKIITYDNQCSITWWTATYGFRKLYWKMNELFVIKSGVFEQRCIKCIHVAVCFLFHCMFLCVLKLWVLCKGCQHDVECCFYLIFFNNKALLALWVANSKLKYHTMKWYLMICLWFQAFKIPSVNRLVYLLKQHQVTITYNIRCHGIKEPDWNLKILNHSGFNDLQKKN